MADNVSVKLDEQVKGSKVIVYMKGNPNFSQCGFSGHTVEILQSYGYPFETVDVLEDQAIREGIKQYSNRPTIPQIFINGKFIVGFDIVHEMHERGELAPLLKVAFSEP
jgi:monothiol glutaredoxin